MSSANTIPLVSVVIPTYRRGHLISRAIKSALRQTFQDWELIVVDDGPGDDTEAVVRGFDDQRIHYVQHETNRGGSAARNTGIQHARGEFVAFLDSDDEWLPEKLEKQLTVFRNGSADLGLVYTGYKRVEDEKKTVVTYSPSLRGFVFEKVLRDGFGAGTSTFLIRRAVLLSLGGFDETLPIFQDYELVLRISKAYGLDFVADQMVVGHESSREPRITGNLTRQISGWQLLFKKHLPEIKRDRRTYATWLTHAGGLYFKAEDMKQGRSYYLRSLRAWPFQLRPMLHVVLSVHPRLHHAFFSAWRGMFWRAFNRKRSASPEPK